MRALAPRRLAAVALAAAAFLACRQQPPAVTTTTAPALASSAAPIPVAPAAAGAAADAPHALRFDPPLGASDVDPARTTMSVTFDRPMDRDGWAWVVESQESAPEVGDSSWDFGATTNTAQVKLQPGRTYVVWLNSAQYPYFRDLQGHTLPPIRWSFTTTAPAPAPAAAGSPAAAPQVETISSHGAAGAAATAPPG